MRLGTEWPAERGLVMAAGSLQGRGNSWPWGIFAIAGQTFPI
ncbi:hypothetical protein [Paenibacillus yonginensis]|nr:hypothetical protein [Paenibacillus yonginensis]